MNDIRKTKDQLIKEIGSLRRKVAALEKIEIKFRSVFENSLDAIFLTAPDGRIFAANPAACHMTGLTEKEICQKGRSAVIDETDQRLPAALEERARTGKFRGELIVRRKDGTTFPAEVSSVVFKDSYGHKRTSTIVRDITDIKKMFEALQKKEAEINAIADNVPGLFSYIDTNCVYRFVNKRYEEWFGVPRAQILGKHCREVLGETTYGLIKDHIERTLSGSPVRYEEKLPYKRGGTRWVSANYVPDIDEYGILKGFYALITNITGMVEAREALEKSEAKYRDLYDNAPDMYHTLDENGVILDCNETEAKMLGYKKEEIIGKHITDFFTEESGKLFRIDFPKLKKKKELLHLPREFIRKDGTTIPISLNVFSVYDENGKFVGTKTIARDVTIIKKIEEALKESEQRFRTLVENSPVGIWQDDPDQRMVYANQALLDMFEVESLAEISGKNWQSFFTAVSLEKIAHESENRLKGLSSSYEVEAIGKLGSKYIGLIYGAPLFTDDNKFQGTIATFLDITEQKEAEDKIQKYHERLSELASRLALIAEDERRRIANEMHDLTGQNLALAKIKLAELKDSVSDRDIQSRLEELDQLIEEAVVSIRSLTFELSPPILYELGFESAAEWLGEQILKKYNIALHFEDDRQPKPLPDEAKVLLYLSLRELIVNIAKHAKAQNATLTLSREGNNIHISVADDGIGFNASDMDYQIMKSASFGIFSTKERLERLGGHLTITSQPGKGATVKMVVPLKE